MSIQCRNAQTKDYDSFDYNPDDGGAKVDASVEAAEHDEFDELQTHNDSIDDQIVVQLDGPVLCEFPLVRLPQDSNRGNCTRDQVERCYSDQEANESPESSFSDAIVKHGAVVVIPFDAIVAGGTVRCFW